MQVSDPAACLLDLQLCDRVLAGGPKDVLLGQARIQLADLDLRRPRNIQLQLARTDVDLIEPGEASWINCQAARWGQEVEKLLLVPEASNLDSVTGSHLAMAISSRYGHTFWPHYPAMAISPGHSHVLSMAMS